MKTKVTVYTKTGKKLVYYDGNDTPKQDWVTFLRGEGTVYFGRFVVPIANIDYVEVEGL